MTSLSTVFDHHERTKHHFDRSARSLGYLDWATQPIPFRNYAGANETQLELDREPPPLAYDRIYEPNAAPSASVDLGSVADLFQQLGIDGLEACRDKPLGATGESRPAATCIRPRLMCCSNQR